MYDMFASFDDGLTHGKTYTPKDYLRELKSKTICDERRNTLKRLLKTGIPKWNEFHPED